MEKKWNAIHTRMRSGPLWKGGFMCMFVCDMSHGYVAKGCTAYLCDVLLAIPSVAPIFSSLLPSLLSPSLPLSSPSPLIFPFSSSFPSFTSFSNYMYLPQHSWIQWIQFGHDGRPILCCTQWWSFCPMKMAGKHLWCERPIALIRRPYIPLSGTVIYGN